MAIHKQVGKAAKRDTKATSTIPAASRTSLVGTGRAVRPASLAATTLPGYNFSQIAIHQPAGGIENQRSDPMEAEADQVAATVTSSAPSNASTLPGATPRSGPGVRRQGLPDQAPRQAGSSTVPPIVRDVISEPGQALDPATISYMEPHFGADRHDARSWALTPNTGDGSQGILDHVRIHTGSRSAASARSLSARAYTLGNHIVFGEGLYAPSTTAGKHLLAHELTHAVQQSSGRATGIHRALDEAALQQAKAPQIMGDETYIDNEIVKLEYFFGQEAAIYYRDGQKLTIGLVPEYVKSPIEAVDFHTARTEHIGVQTDDPNALKYIPRGQHVAPPPGTTLGDVLKSLTETVRFKIEPESKRIVPTHLNTRTAPVVCEMLRTCEAEYVATTDAVAAGAVKVLKKLEVVLLIYSLIPTGGAVAGMRGAGMRGAGGATTAALARAEATLVQEFLAILKAGGSKALTIEGVLFDGVRVFRQGTELVVRRFGIKRLATTEAGKGRILQASYERAAIEAAKQAGAKTVRIAMEKPINPAWKAYLESQGYTWQVVEKVGEVGFEGLMTKIIKL